MSVLTTMSDLLARGQGTISFELSKQEGSGLSLVVRPIANFDDKGEERLMRLKAALSMPLKISGSAEEIEGLLIEKINEEVTDRRSWSRLVSNIEREMAEADTKSKTETPKGKQSSAKKEKADSKPNEQQDFDI